MEEEPVDAAPVVRQSDANDSGESDGNGWQEGPNMPRVDVLRHALETANELTKQIAISHDLRERYGILATTYKCEHKKLDEYYKKCRTAEVQIKILQDKLTQAEAALQRVQAENAQNSEALKYTEKLKGDVKAWSGKAKQLSDALVARRLLCADLEGSLKRAKASKTASEAKAQSLQAKLSALKTRWNDVVQLVADISHQCSDDLPPALRERFDKLPLDELLQMDSMLEEDDDENDTTGEDADLIDLTEEPPAAQLEMEVEEEHRGAPAEDGETTEQDCLFPKQEDDAVDPRADQMEMEGEERDESMMQPDATRGQKPEEEETVEKEKEEGEGEEGRGDSESLKSAPPKATSGKKAEEETEEMEKEGGMDEKEEAVAEETMPRRARRSAKSAPVSDKEAPAHVATKKVEEDEDEEKNGTPSRRTTRAASAKGRGRKTASVKRETEDEKMDSDEEEEAVEGKKGRRRGRKSASGKTLTASPKKASKRVVDDEAEVALDDDVELNELPEPLMIDTKSPVKRAPSMKRGKETKEEEEKKEEGEGNDPMQEEGTMDATPAVARRGRARPPGSGAKRKAASPRVSSSSAKRPTINADASELDADAQQAADQPKDEEASLMPGARVFAAFGKVFYPARIGERDALGRYLVQFVEDQMVRPVPPAGIVPLAAVTVGKECLFLPSVDDEPIQCRVLRSPNEADEQEWQAGIFKLIDNEDAEHEAAWSQLQLAMASSEWKQHLNARSKKVADVNADHITPLSGKRERRSRFNTDSAVAMPSMAGGTSSAPTTSSRRASVTRNKTPVASVARAASASATPAARRGRGGPSKASLAAEAAAAAEKTVKEEEEEDGETEKEEEEEEREKKGEEEEEEGEKDEEEAMETEESAAPAEKKPEMNPRLFVNKLFVLTSGSRANDVYFRRNEMKQQIVERGGVVVADINLVPLDADAYLISDKYYCTQNYLAAMARGMPCLSHKWLAECVQREELAPHDGHVLAGGQGLLDGVIYPLPDVRGKLLLGRAIMLHSKKDSSTKRGTTGFKEIWSPIVSLLGARVVDDASLADWSDAAALPDFDILLTDSSCAPEIVNALESADKGVVGCEWLIQSMIMGACLDFSAHPRFRYDSGESSTKEGNQEQQA